jgi:Fe-S cluster assembly protein SufD
MENIAIQKNKERAQNIFTNLEMPSFKYGEGMKLKLDLDFEDFFTSMASQNPETISIIAPENVQIKKLSQMDEKFILEHLEKLVPANEDKLIALHYASFEDVHVIIIPANVKITTPILINSRLSSIAKAEHIIVVGEENSHAKIIEVATSEETGKYKTQIVQIYLKQNAHLSYCTLQQQKKTYSFSTKRGEVKKDGSLTWIDFILGGAFTRLHLKTSLSEQGAQAEKLTGFYGSDEQLFDVKTDSFHLAPRTNSKMNAKGVLSKQSKTIYRGIVNIAKAAPGCVGYQRSDAMLIGENAKCDAVPILEVENDDVTCSHGATLGQFDEEKLFYLLSRGLTEDEAKKVIVEGFLEPIIGAIPDNEIQNSIRNLLREKIEQ